MVLMKISSHQFITEERGQLNYTAIIGFVAIIGVIAVLLLYGPMKTVTLSGEITRPTGQFTEDTKEVAITVTNAKNGQPVKDVVVVVRGCSYETTGNTDSGGKVRLVTRGRFEVPVNPGYCTVDIRAYKKSLIPRYNEWSIQENVRP
jgi:hypothetical protein